ncbi:MAG: Trk system potassium transporter TrkA [Kiritimatiellae bacterium]|nr:Trk system potassium transporter TrkA [Kiritimatiellia bacterium]
MRIVVVGGGEAGGHLAEQFCADGHDVVVVDTRQEALSELEARLDLMTVCGSGADPETLERADVSRADMLVAVTDRDDTNLLACIFGRERGVKRTAARVSSASYVTSRHIGYAKLGVDLLVNQYSEYARELYHALRMPGSIEADELLDGRVLAVGMPVHMDSPLLGRSLKEFAGEEWIRKIRFFAVMRGDEAGTPTGETSLMVGDAVYFAGEPDGVSEFMKWAWPEQRKFQRVVIAGGGELGLQTARLLEGTRMEVVLVEQDEDRADYCAERLNRALVLKGNALDRETLAGIGPGEDMAYVAATGSDENNIIGCLVAERHGARFTAAQVGKEEYIGVVNRMRLVDRVVNPHLALINAMLHYVRGKNVLAASIMAHLPGELLEMALGKGHEWEGKTIAELSLPKGVVLVTALRGGAVKTPTGALRLEAGDKVVVYGLPKALEELEGAFGR